MVSEFVERLVLKLTECRNQCHSRVKAELCHTFPNHIEKSEMVEIKPGGKISAQSAQKQNQAAEIQNGQKILHIEYDKIF